jgi:hypothetical protein
MGLRDADDTRRTARFDVRVSLSAEGTPDAAGGSERPCTAGRRARS